MKNSKTNQKQANQTITINDTLAGLAQNRLQEINDHIDGYARLRATRWPGQTSLYDTNRMKNLIDVMSYGHSVSVKKIHTLKNEVPTFEQVLGPNLSRSLRKTLQEA